MRLIDVSVLKEWVENWLTKNRFYHHYAKNDNIPIPELYDILEQMPSAEPKITLESAIDYLTDIGWMQEHDKSLTEPKRGHWKLHIFDGIMGGRPRAWVCDICNGLNVYKTDFCPNCGADMRGKR